MSSKKVEKLNIYKKYYSLEDYLFKEISNNFKEKHYLTNEEFFAIVIWKSNRSKTKVLKGVEISGKTIKRITEKFEEQNREEKINNLVKISGIHIPIASAILSVCFSNEFTIADYRVAETINKIKNTEIKNPSYSIENYLEYLDICKEIAEKWNLSLRDLDKCLWGYDFYKGKSGLKELVRTLN
ncbi:MAG: hypothetical protein WC662_05125 [Candidatus Paceibacterota bacterium]|jgi:thermostable 8-oxoguanine DNA glycosylase